MDLIKRLRKLQEFLLESGAAQTTLALPSPRMLSLPAPDSAEPEQAIYASAVIEPEVVAVSRDLFASGHFSLSVQEAFKAVEKFIQHKSESKLSGTKLMEQVFSVDKPVLQWSARTTISQRDEHAGYQRIYSGSMLGIRNPAAHEFNWVDDAPTALEMLVLAQHLLRKAKRAIRSDSDIASGNLNES